MPRQKDPNSVPAKMLPLYEKVAGLTDRFCGEHLDDAYRDLCRRLAAALARKRPSPLEKGKPAVWAAGIVHALGTINFLFDRSFAPYVPSPAIAEFFGVGLSTASGKSSEIRKMFGMGPFQHEWMLPSLVDSSPVTWLLSVNGIFVDIRMMPLEAQEIAFDRGLIPYIPQYRLLDELEAHLPMTFQPVEALLPVLIDKLPGYTKGDALSVTDVYDMGDEGGACCGINLPGSEELLVIGITYLVPPPDHPLAAMIEQYRSLRIQAIELGLIVQS